ncbi:hypothetical protein SAMN02927921_02483 [Sinomicrobium oceani]|uniref:HEPN domain-containing protein n=1 Tax=Sinomicrobium oceani TaxID=1150368 RepID=A0A1K1QD42_9FLAO|nr:hypothetical protein [Sinomicrobium oceani]SFW57831.1 hypothetical protein SAMN02927921_02483 [Sinomicrobium oceani]
MNTEISYIVHKVVAIMDVTYVYAFPIAGQTGVLILTAAPNRPNKNLPSVSDIFAQYPEYRYRVYTEHTARTQLEQGNLFFLHACMPGHLQYCGPDTQAPELLSAAQLHPLLSKARSCFEHNYDKAVSFSRGAQFFLEAGQMPPTAFMLHQAFELAYRAAECLVMGREKVCHRIGTHQQYILAHVPQLGQVFAPEKEPDATLLHLIDRAYHEVRYGAYEIRPEQLTVLQAKLDKVLALTEKQFLLRYYACKKGLEDMVQRQAQDCRPLPELAERFRALLGTGGELAPVGNEEDLRQAIHGMIKNYFAEVQGAMQLLDSLIALYGEVDKTVDNPGLRYMPA